MEVLGTRGSSLVRTTRSGLPELWNLGATSHRVTILWKPA